MVTNAEVSKLRRRIRAEVPARAFARTPWCGWILLATNGCAAAAIYAVMRFTLPWYASIALGVFLGYAFFVGAIIAHDAIHGSIVSDRRQRNILGLLGFYPFLISAHLWSVWHTAHHSRTNTQHDPDSNLSFDESRHNAFTRTLAYLMPAASNRIVGSVFYLYWFSAIGQALLWNHRGFKELNFASYGLNQRRAYLEVAGYAAYWTALLVAIGPARFVVVALVPMMVANLIFLAFATSEHIYLPATPVNDALENTVSVRVPKIVDFLTLNFSHHVEHHLFPGMSFVNTPHVRRWLRANMRDRYLEIPLLQALGIVFSTQRLYRSTYVLANVSGDERWEVDTREIAQSIRSAIAS